MKPPGDASAAVHIAAGLTGAQGNTQQLPPPQAHSPGQGRHIAVVACGPGDISAGLPHRSGQKVPAQAVIGCLLHPHKQAGAANFTVYHHPGGGNAYAVHSRQMGLGRTQGGGDPLIMIAQVRRRLRLPDHLLGVNGLPVYHRRGLAVAAAQVDADAAALRPGCCRGRRFPLRGQRLPPLHLKGRTVYAGQKRPVKGPRPRRGVRPLQPSVNRLIRREKGAAPSQPQGGFYQEQRIFLVCRLHSLIPVQAQ